MGELIIIKEESTKAEALARKKDRNSAAQAERNEANGNQKAEKAHPLDIKDERRIYSFPAVPVGVIAPKAKKAKGKGSVSLETGTATGRSLFNMLAADPVPGSQAF